MADRALPSRAVNGLIDHPWIILVTAGVVAFTIWAVGTRSSDHELRAVFSEAVSVYPGLDVRIDGLDAGKVQAVEHEGGHAVLTLGVNDDVWPLTQGTTATMRFGTTVGNGTRIIDLDPGPASGAPLPEKGIIANDETVESVEFDDVFDTFDAKTRASLQGMTGNMGETFGSRADELGDGVEATGPALDSLAGFSSELVRNEPELRSLVRNAAKVTRTTAARTPQIEGLISGAQATFAEFSQNTEGITGTLDRFPEALRQTRTTLKRVDGSLGGLDELVKDVAPGAEELAPLARDMRPALVELTRTVPGAVATLRTARQAAPDITELLKRVQPFSDDAAPVLADLAPMVGCLRPYAPEIAGLAATWASWGKGFDAEGHYGRIWANSGPSAADVYPNLKSDDYRQLVPGQSYALVRPPGFNAGKPWYLPECGAGQRGVDAAQDPEDGR